MAHSPGPPTERAANGYFFTPHGRAVAPANGAFLPRLLGRQGSGGFLPLCGGPPARFGDFPAVESHAGVRGRSAPKLPTGTLRCKPPQAALRPGWRSAPKLSAGTLRCKPLPGGALHVFGFHLRKERSPMQRIIRLPSSFTVIRETLPAPPHSSQVFRLSTGKH